MKEFYKKYLSVMLTVLILFLDCESHLCIEAYGDSPVKMVTLYFMDNTDSGWISNDMAVIQLVDNTYGHDSYIMTTKDYKVWQVQVPETAYNITINRYSPDMGTLWNSWSAGGRDGRNAYAAEGNSNGSWRDYAGNFNIGDMIFLDVSEFEDWNREHAVLYANFSDAAKNENDITISEADAGLYSPKNVMFSVAENIYAYVVTEEDALSDILRFWRGNEEKLWNYSVALSHEVFMEGYNCIRINGWDNSGSVYKYDYVPEWIELDTDNLIANDDNRFYTLGESFTDFHGRLRESEKVEKFYVEIFDKNGINIYRQDIVPASEWSLEEFGLINGINVMIFTAAMSNGLQSVYELTIHCNTSRYMEKLVIDKNDDDGDGLWNYFEDYFGTDKRNPDTDGDGLNDFAEVYTFGYNPLSCDTDENGISDYEEDCDGDSLTNGFEISIGTNPLKKDTDGEGLTDNEEMKYGTSPLLTDTDGDGIDDYTEIWLGSNPLAENQPDETFTKEFEGEEFDISKEQSVYPKINLTADGKTMQSFQMELLDHSNLINFEMAGYMGAAYDFTMEGDFERAELTFIYNPQYIDSQMINNDDFYPAIYYFDEEKQILEEVTNQRVDLEHCSVTAELEHFSTYLLVNKRDLEELWNQTLKLPEDCRIYEKNQVVFVLDTSGSMATNDSGYIRTNLVTKFLEKINSKDEIGIVGFDSKAKSYTSVVTADRELISSAINDLIVYGNRGSTYINKGLTEAVRMLDKSSDSTYAQQCIFLLTDGHSSDTPTDSYLKTLKEKGIKVYTIGLGNVSEKYLKRIAEATDGEYYYAEYANDLNDILPDFQKDIVGNDENGDLLDDTLAKLICQGEITTITGTRIFDETCYEKLQSNNDYDDDGLLNGEEIGIYYLFGKPYIYLYSSPELIDTDFDGYTDYEEEKEYGTSPLRKSFVMNRDDYMYVSMAHNFESCIAGEEYIDSSVAGNVVERFFDVLLGGGELRLKDIAIQDITNYFIDYAESSGNLYVDSKYVNYVNDLLRGYCDLLPYTKDIQVVYQRGKLTARINRVSKIVNKCRRSFKYMAKHLDLFSQSFDELQALKTNYAAMESYITANIKRETTVGTKAGWALSFISCTMDNLNDTATYFAGLELMKGYQDMLEELKHCGIEAIEEAAETILVDINSKYGKWKTVIKDYTDDIFSTGCTCAISYFVTKWGLPGLAIDLAACAGTIILGESLSTRLKNSMSYNLAISIQLAASPYIREGKYAKDAENHNIIIFEGDSKATEARNKFNYLISSKKYAESNYIGYLQDDSTFFDADYFLYQKKDSEEKALANVGKLTDLLEEYALK